MFKFVVFSCLVSVAFAGIISAPATIAFEKTIVEPHSTIIEQPTISHVASVVKSIPTAHSYQSQTQYHSKTIAEPIYAHGVQKSIVSTPIVKKVVEHVPAYVAEPIKTISYHGSYAPVAAYSVPSAPLAYAHAAPLNYAAYSHPVQSYAHHW
jgi:hypothetical protein